MGMDEYIPISAINDFLYSPASLYMHVAYQDYARDVFKSRDQVRGSIYHERVDSGSYSTSRHIISGKMVYSEKYKLVGKIDIFDSKRGALIERKSRIKRIYKGYRFQLHAQMLCLEEMGFDVFDLYLHSMEDNRRYKIDFLTTREEREFDILIKRMRNFDPKDLLKEHVDERGAMSIYGGIAW